MEAANLVQCPMDSFFMNCPLDTQMNLALVEEIQAHVLSRVCIHPPLNNLHLHGTFQGNTPLILATQQGHLDSVERIVNYWGADIRAPTSYYGCLNGITHLKIEGATPLFVAALRGHSEIVRYLIGKGADVSATTSTENNGLSPLHAALMDSHPELYFKSYTQGQYLPPVQTFHEMCVEGNTIVRDLLDAGANPSSLALDGTPVWMEPLCRVDAVATLVKSGLNLKLLNSSGNTILHHWITGIDSYYRSPSGITEEDREVVVKLLIDMGADLQAQDRKNFRPILAAAESEKFEILDLLLMCDRIDRHDKIDALELAGAHLLTMYRDRASRYWHQALQLREESDPIKKIPLQMTSQGNVEWVTLEELQNVMVNPLVDPWIQATVVRLRIYAAKSCEALKDFIESEFTYYSAKGDQEDNWSYDGTAEEVPTVFDNPDLMLDILRVFLQFYPKSPMLSEQTQNLVYEISVSLTKLDDDPLDPLFKVLRIKSSLQLILEADPDGPSSLSYEFYALLCGLPDILFQKNIRNYLSRTARNDVGTLLAIRACETQDWETLRLLLHIGADPNTNVYGNWPLHIVAGQEVDPIVLNGEVELKECTPAQLLFNYGANPHAINKEGKTAVQIWMEKNCGGEGMQSTAWSHRPQWCRDTVPKLSSLTAKTIHIHGINYSLPGNVPVDCLLILENH